ncbi:MAG: protein kinase [Gammaproteobacteria bacterium]
MSESLIKVPGYKIPGYGIEREIGRGGMATVYLALQESLNRHVALKVMNPVLTTDEDFKARFLNEGHIVGQLSHSNIVTVFDIGVHDNHYYLSMELLRGGSLRDKIRQGMPLGMALKISKALGNALGYAHQRGFIHRDIKPLNVLFREDGSPVLTDFGIAKALGSSSQLTRTGYTFGSIGYMSPEQSLGKPIDHRADIYSFGVMFWEILTGDRLYESADAFALALKHATAPIPSLPPGLEMFQPLVLKLLAKQPEERYENAEQFVADIERMQFDLALTEAGPTNPAQAAVSDHPSSRFPPPPNPQDATQLSTAANPTPTTSNSARKSVTARPEEGEPQTSKSQGGNGGKLALALVVLAALGAGGYFMLQQQKPPVDSGTALSNDPQPDPDLVATTGTTQTAPDSTTADNTLTSTTTTTGITAGETPSQLSPEQQIAALLEEGRAHLAAGRYTAPADSNAFKAFSAVQELDPENTEARQALLELGRIAQAQNIVQRATELFQQGADQDSLEAIAVGLRLQPDNAELQDLKAQIEAAATATVATQSTEAATPNTGVSQNNETVPSDGQSDGQTLSLEQLLAQAQTQWDTGKLFEPPGDNAFDSYQQALRLDPSNNASRQALLALGKMRQVNNLAQRAHQLLEQGKLQESLTAG